MSLCPLPERCGSCGWSHIPYQKQLEQKLSDINGSLKLKKLDERVTDILPAPRTEHYRNRMDFVIDFQGNVGLREKGKWWRVIDGHPCFISDEKIEEHFHTVREWAKTAGLTFFDRKAHTGLLRYAVIRATTSGESMITIVTSAPVDNAEKTTLITALNDLAAKANPTTLLWSRNDTVSDVSHDGVISIITGPGTIEENIGGTRYRISPNAFFQTNSRGAELLLGTVQEFAGDLTNKTLLDLYCGTGFFAVALGKNAKRTIGVEFVDDAIVDAKANAALNNVTAEFHSAKTEDFDWAAYNADVVILDPPRAGLHDQALQDVLRIAPQSIVYVSCNYKSFARELTFLKEKYDVTQLRAVDMFPHTPHVELVAKLERKV